MTLIELLDRIHVLKNVRVVIFDGDGDVASRFMNYPDVGIETMMSRAHPRHIGPQTPVHTWRFVSDTREDSGIALLMIYI